MKFKQRLDAWWDKSRESRRKIRSYWKSLMASTQDKFSRGAANITRIISHARNDNWRRKD